MSSAPACSCGTGSGGTVARWVIVWLAALLMAAHQVRSGLAPLALAILAVPVLGMLWRAGWSVWLLRVLFLLGTLDWVLTAGSFIARRQAQGRPWSRLALIMGGVALCTALAALLVPRAPWPEPPSAGGGEAA